MAWSGLEAKEISELGVATIYEAAGKAGLLTPALRPILAGYPIAGRAITAAGPAGDNLVIHRAVEHCAPGDILVYRPLEADNAGVVGEILATALLMRGAAGAILFSGTRDVAALRAMPFPVWSLAIHARGTTKRGEGEVGGELLCEGVQLRSGDLVVADDDGVVVVPSERVEEVLGRARERRAHEAETLRRVAAGELTVDIHGLR